MSEGRLLAALAGFVIVAIGVWWWFARMYAGVAGHTRWLGDPDNPLEDPPTLKPPDSPAA